MNISYLRDSEVAVTIDSLIDTRENLENNLLPHPNVDAALQAINAIMSPSTYGLTLVAGNISLTYECPDCGAEVDIRTAPTL